LGDSITVGIGYTGDTPTVFKGYVTGIADEILPGIHEISCQDVLWRAAQHWIVATDLANPFRRTNIAVEDLIGDLLAEAGITNYSGDSPGFTLATGVQPAEFQLVSSLDACNQVADIVAWHIYADQGGTVHFKNIIPEPGSSSASFVTGTSGTIITANQKINTDNLRNKVVVFGYPPITAEAHASSSYLPAGFYKTAIIASPLIDTQSMADGTASYNLNKWNRAAYSIDIEVEGDPDLHARQTVSVTESFTGASGDWFVYDVTHDFQKQYITRMTLVK
jgi:hypothetical protein